MNYIKMLRECGDALDYPKRFMSADLLRKYWRNETMMKTWLCMISFSKSEVAGVDDCPVPCEELELSVVSSFHELSHKKNNKNNKKNKKKNETSTNRNHDEYCEDEEVEPVYRVDIQYVNIDSYRIVEEKQLYSWDQIAGEVGGFLGLVIGASFISIIEIVLYLILCCISK